MAKPIIIDLPHNLGAAEAKRRMADGIHKLHEHIPDAGASVQHSWQGDRMNLAVQAMGQEISGHLDVEEKLVRLEFMLPGILGMFAGPIAGMLRSKGAAMLEDKSKKNG